MTQGPSFSFIRYDKKGQIGYVTLNRPEVLNALHPPACQEIAMAWDDFDADDSLRVAILTGAGERAFCAGFDLSFMREALSRGESLHATISAFRDLTRPRDPGTAKPTICAVNGYALGGGLELALACDIIVASERAEFGLPEPRLGLFPGVGGMHRLPRVVPLKIAIGYLLTGRRFSAAEAHRWGMVNEVVPQAELMPVAEKWAQDILAGAPLAVQAIRQAATEGLNMTLAEACETVFPAEERCALSRDVLEGLSAFFDKRTPSWQAR